MVPGHGGGDVRGVEPVGVVLRIHTDTDNEDWGCGLWGSHTHPAGTATQTESAFRTMHMPRSPAERRRYRA